MIDPIEILLSLISGLIGGMLYFGGLWWTVVQFQTAKKQAGFYVASLAVRMGCLLAGIVFLLQFGVIEMLVAFVGFVIARLALVRWIGLATPPKQRIGTR